MPEIPEGYVAIPAADHALYQRSHKLFGTLYDDPEFGASMKQALKKADPTIRIPEIDVAEPLLKPIREEIETFKKTAEELRAENAKLRQDREDEKAIGDLQSRIDAATKKHRLTPDGVAEMKKIMSEKGVADPELIAEHIVNNIERAKPVTGSNFGPADLNVLGMNGKSEDDSIKSLHQDPLRWLDQAVPEIMAEFDQEAA